MDFARQALAAGVLVAMTLCLQCAGMAFLIHRATVYVVRAMNRLSAWHVGMLVFHFTVWMLVLHLLQVLLWAAFYRWRCLASWESCFYFSATSYSTVGYGDVVLPPGWRFLGPIESMVGVVLCGISVSVLFAIISRLIDAEAKSPAQVKTQIASINL
jgi:voltage-gated potassium channel